MKQSLKPHDIDDQLVIKTKHHHHLIRYTYIQHYYEYWIHTYMYSFNLRCYQISIYTCSRSLMVSDQSQPAYFHYSRDTRCHLTSPLCAPLSLACPPGRPGMWEVCEASAGNNIALSALLHISRLMVNFVFNSEHPSMAWELAQWSELSSARSAVC